MSGVHRFSKNLETTSKLWVPEEWHGASFHIYHSQISGTTLQNSVATATCLQGFVHLWGKSCVFLLFQEDSWMDILKRATATSMHISNNRALSWSTLPLAWTLLVTSTSSKTWGTDIFQLHICDYISPGNCTAIKILRSYIQQFTQRYVIKFTDVYWALVRGLGSVNLFMQQLLPTLCPWIKNCNLENDCGVRACVRACVHEINFYSSCTAHVWPHFDAVCTVLHVIQWV